MKRLLAAVAVVVVACSELPTVPDVSPPSEIPGVLASLIPAQLAKLVASDAAADDAFGLNVALSGDVAVVGAPGDDDAGDASGSAYVFRRAGDGTWNQEANLVASDAAAWDLFGIKVALSGDVAVVGAPDDDDAGSSSGSAYVFRRAGDGTWSEEAKLVAGDGAADDGFGIAMAVSGDVAMVGAPGDDDAVHNSGSAYVFRRAGDGTWSEEAKLVARDGTIGAAFGDAVAVSGDVAVVGAPGDGSAYVFRHAGGVWAEEQQLVPSDVAIGAVFGDAVALGGDVAVVGARGHPGSAHVFLHAGGVWAEEAKLVASDAASAIDFGVAVALSGDVAVVGAPGDGHAGDDSGSAYVFELLGDPEAVIEHVTDELGTLAAASGSTLAEELEDAISRLETALDELGETPPDLVAVMQALEQAVDLLEAAVRDELLDPVQGAALMNELAGIARDLAVAAIHDAVARGGDADRIDEAQTDLAEADTLRASGEFTDAVDKYKDALVKAESA
jgi:hypothetical protein